MPIDQKLFDRDASLWWSENSHCALLKGLIPERIGYLRRVFTERLRHELSGATVLDVGCGGGLLAEEVARLGCRVTGIDPSPRSIDIATQHAAQTGLSITYRVASGEQLPFEDNRFDIVYCCDVLEHVRDVNAVIAESARVLKPDGMYLYDTINRTWLSKFLMITLLQEWEWLRVAPSNLHDWKQFIRPKELDAILRRQGLEPRDMTGLIPDMSPVENLKRLVAIRKFKRGEITYAELGQHLVFRLSRLTFINYMGYAVKP